MKKEMRKEIKELLELNALIDDLRSELCDIVDVRERILYLNDLKAAIDELQKYEYDNLFRGGEED